MVEDRDLAALEEEYTELYDRREDIQARMNDIKYSLTVEEYGTLVVKIEGLQLATLKMPTDSSRR